MMNEILKNKPQASQDGNDKFSPLGIDNLKNAVVAKDADTIKHEEEHPEEYLEKQKQKMMEDAERMASQLQETKALYNTIDTAGWDGLDGGQRYVDLAPDSAGRRLTAKEILFCRYYVCTNNIKQSLVLAGLSGSNRELRIINKPDIRAFISELTDLRLKKLGYDRTTVIENLAIIANQDVKDYIDVTKSQHQAKNGSIYTRTDIEVKDFDDINRDYAKDEYGEDLLDANGNPVPVNSMKTKAIKSIKKDDNGNVVVEFHDKMGALKQLANMLDMESPQKITLNDETKRAETEKSILKKLEALVGDSNTDSENNDTKNDENDTKNDENDTKNVES